MALEITDSNFAEITNSDKLVIVDFWAEWCGPCRMLTPLIEEAAEHFKDTAVIGKLNVDENPETASKYSVRSIPTILFLKNGEEIHKNIGALSKKDLFSAIESRI